MGNNKSAIEDGSSNKPEPKVQINNSILPDQSKGDSKANKRFTRSQSLRNSLFGRSSRKKKSVRESQGGHVEAVDIAFEHIAQETDPIERKHERKQSVSPACRDKDTLERLIKNNDDFAGSRSQKNLDGDTSVNSISSYVTDKSRSIINLTPPGIQCSDLYSDPRDTQSEAHRRAASNVSLRFRQTTSKEKVNIFLEEGGSLPTSLVNKSKVKSSPSLVINKPEDKMTSKPSEASQFKHFDSIQREGAAKLSRQLSSSPSNTSNTKLSDDYPGLVCPTGPLPITNPHHASRRNSNVSILVRTGSQALNRGDGIEKQKSFDGEPGDDDESGESEKTYFVAIKDWKGRDGEDLDVKLHEKLQRISISSDSWWFMRSCVTGSKGTIPSNILVPFNALDGEDWFFGSLSRKHAEEHLKLAGRHGTFLIRNSETIPSEYALSVLDGNAVKHYRIREKDTGGYFIEIKKPFANLQELVEHYSQSNAKGLCARLSIACAKALGVVASDHMPKDAWELKRSDLAIDVVLGKGHFGVVRRGTFQGRLQVAIKELRRGESDMKEFQTEVNALKKLKHERLLALLGVCTQEEPYYIVTEYLKNGSLLDYLKGSQGQKLILEEQLHIALQVAEGMAYLEREKYIHRDLAARNVLLDDRLNSKIADFGMSKLVTETFYTASNDTKVPIKWTALEALLHCQFSSKSDVWSFGILLAEIMTKGVTPYRDLDNSEIVEFLQKGQRLAQEKSCMEDHCYNIMLSCWAKQPSNRPNFYDLQKTLTDYIRVVKARKEVL